MAQQLSAEREEREVGFQAARVAQNHGALAVQRRQAGDVEGATVSLTEATRVLATITKRGGDDDGGQQFASSAQAVCAAQIFEAFLTTGTLGQRPVVSELWRPELPQPPSNTESGAKRARTVPDHAAPTYADEEWLSALVSAAHEIGRYANVAATTGEVSSVQAARGAVSQLHEALQAFDLRNGNLRRSFDSLKYVVRRLEDVVYELSLFPPPTTATAAAATTTDISDASTPSPSSAQMPLLVDAVALEAARASYAALDEAREAIIKKCREPQKLSKQAIFALHRGDYSTASKQLSSAKAMATSLLEKDIAAAPALRSQGSVRAMLEEYAEAQLFATWLHGSGSNGNGNGQEEEGSSAASSVLPPRTILLHGDAALLGDALEPVEYLGGICDLVGEIGRYAVARATQRDAAAVGEALSTAMAVQAALLELGSATPRGIHKKADPLRMAVKKMEQLLYELSLVERSGRVREAPADIPEPVVDGGDE